VRYWGFTPQEYAVEFRRYTAWVPGYGKPLDFIASGPNGDDLSWTKRFFEEILRKGKPRLQNIYGMGLHHYAWNLSRGKTTDWEKGKGDALQFDVTDWYELLREGQRLEPMLESYWQAMSEFDQDHHVKLVVDEWGPWYRPGSEATPGDILEQTPTLRDAVFSAMTLDILNRHAAQVAMGNCAQLINCLNSLYLAHEDRFVVTPVGHIFDLYSGHQGGESVRAVFSAPEVQYDRDGKPATFFGLNGSASLHGKDLLLTVVNPDSRPSHEASISLSGASVASATGRVLTSSDIHACNTFTTHDAVAPRPTDVSVRSGAFTHTFPAASVTALALRLA
jgi:alpha-L-arabinofuranosidase